MARVKKSRTLKGKLGKTGSKEQLKEQRKAQKAATPRAFTAKKAKQRKLQAVRKLERLGLAKPEESKVAAPRPRRFVYEAPVIAGEVSDIDDQVTIEVTANDLLSALTEQN